jgi:hypothetical protein
MKGKHDVGAAKRRKDIPSSEDSRSMFYVGQRVICVCDKDCFDEQYLKHEPCPTDTSGPQRGGVYTVAEINKNGEIMLAEMPLNFMNSMKAKILSFMAGKQIDSKEPDTPAWWPSNLFRPFGNSRKDIEWFELLESVRNIACYCGYARRHNGKLYNYNLDKAWEVYAIAIKQFVGFAWGDKLGERWWALHIFDAVNVVMEESNYNIKNVPPACWPPPDDVVR